MRKTLPIINEAHVTNFLRAFQRKQQSKGFSMLTRRLQKKKKTIIVIKSSCNEMKIKVHTLK